ncbi:MAG: alpha-galactosidase [Christensenellales bacterium]|jgi:hypothetical protein
MYINFKKFSVRFDLDSQTFCVYYDGMGAVVRDARITSLESKREPQAALADYAPPRGAVTRGDDHATLTVTYGGEDIGRQDVSMRFRIDNGGVTLFTGGEGTASVGYAGHLNWGAHTQRETMAVRLGDGGARALRAAYGPAASIHDNALFDKDSDSAISFHTAGTFRLSYDWAADAYAFSFDTMGWDYARALEIRVERDVYERTFNLDYKKFNPNTTFKTPPVGWMTWYAVQFDAGEKTVLENARWQAEHLKDYGADTIWVDWEWYHRDFSSVGADDLDMYNPDPIAYPNGLKHVADRIREMGFIPALWIGPTCDPRENEMIAQYPDAVMAKRPSWCGQYFLDPTHPDFLEKMLPRMVRQAIEWGYEAVKWDCLPITTTICDDCHDTIYDPSKSSREAMIGAFRAAREVLGEDTYMLYCAGTNERDMDLAVSVFDAARIGGDIFRWEEFISQCVDKVYKYYALHTVVCNNDPDNVVLREKFNTYDQAVTRAAFVSLAGLPFTLGDNLPDLPAERVEVLKRSIPPVPAHPMDVRASVSDGRTVILNLAVEKPDMRANIVDVINLTAADARVRVDLRADVGVEGGAHYVYDYWNRAFLGAYTDGLELALRAHASRVLAVHRVQDVPQLISTSRHIAQGAMDLEAVSYDAAAQTLVGKSQVVGGEPYEVVVCAPEDLRVFGEGNRTSTNEIEHLGGPAWRLTFYPENTGAFDWTIAFSPRTRT